MPIGLLVAMIVMATSFLANGRAARDRFWTILGVIVLVTAALSISRDGLRPIIIAGPITGAFALFQCLLGLWFWAEFSGLPRPFALRLGIGLKNPALAFDIRLHALRSRFADAIRLAQADPDRQTDALIEAETLVRLERALRAPDLAWSQLRDDIADDDSAWIDLIRNDAPSERLADHIEALGPVLDRWGQLRDGALAEQRLIASPRIRRRGKVVVLASLSLSLLAAGLAAARAYDLFGVGVTHFQSWLAIGMLVGGLIGSAAALVAALERDRADTAPPGTVA